MRTRLVVSGCLMACLAQGCFGKTADDAPKGDANALGGAPATGGAQTTRQTGGTNAGGATIRTTTASGQTSVGGTSFTPTVQGGTHSNVGGVSASAGAGATTAHAGAGGTNVPLDLDAGCARLVDLEPTENNIVFLLDKSGSMGDQLNSATGEYDWQNCDLRWNPVIQAVRAFVADPDSAGLNASLNVLPSDGDEYARCDVASYLSGSAAIRVPMTPLDPAGVAKFEGQLCACGNNSSSACIVPGGGTPTRPALQGTIDYAALVNQRAPQSRTAIILITDGEPGFAFAFQGATRHLTSCDDLPSKGCAAGSCGCVENDTFFSDLAADAEVQKVAETIEGAPARSLYVVGVGDVSEETLSVWGAASGNNVIDLRYLTPAEMITTLQARLKTIRSSLQSCKFDLPTALGPIDPDLTNVQFTSANGGKTILSRTSTGTAASCVASHYEWYFDDPVVPTKIQLCQPTCTALQRDPDTSIQLMLGCGGIPPVN